MKKLKKLTISNDYPHAKSINLALKYNDYELASELIEESLTVNGNDEERCEELLRLKDVITHTNKGGKGL